MMTSTPGKGTGEENSEQVKNSGGRNEFGLLKERKKKSQTKLTTEAKPSRQREEVT